MAEREFPPRLLVSRIDANFEGRRSASLPAKASGAKRTESHEKPMQFCGIARLYTGSDWNRVDLFCTDRVHPGRRGTHSLSLAPLAAALIAVLLALTLPIAVAEAPSAGADAHAASAQRREARGWIELEQNQRAYRDRVEPLGLKQQRQLETIERSQGVDLRALQQRDAREIERLERQQRITPSSNLDRTRAPTRDATTDIRRRAERHRTNIRLQQEGLPFRR